MEGSMRALGLQGLRRIPFLRWRSRNSSTGSAVTLVSVKRRLPFCRHGGSSFLMQLFWKFRTQWKQAFRWQRSSAQCSYDLYSYSLNFDDGPLPWVLSNSNGMFLNKTSPSAICHFMARSRFRSLLGRMDKVSFKLLGVWSFLRRLLSLFYSCYLLVETCIRTDCRVLLSWAMFLHPSPQIKTIFLNASSTDYAAFYLMFLLVAKKQGERET